MSLALLVAGCEKRAADPAFGSPKATVRTLLRAYHLDQMSPGEIQRRMSRSGDDRFGVVDEALVDRCFVDLDRDTPVDEGLVGFLVGVLAARRDVLEQRIQGDDAQIFAGPVARIVLRKTDEGWKIVLAESVPRAYRERMEALYDKARKGASR
jgi:hypothetical protein